MSDCNLNYGTPFLSSFMIYHYLFKYRREFKAPFGAEINSIGYMLAGEAEYCTAKGSFKVEKGDLADCPKTMIDIQRKIEKRYKTWYNKNIRNTTEG